MKEYERMYSEYFVAKVGVDLGKIWPSEVCRYTHTTHPAAHHSRIISSALSTEDVNEIVEENHALFRAHRIRARGTRILEDEILPFRVAAPKLRRGLGGRRNLPHERKGLGVVLAAGIEEAAVFPDSVCLALTWERGDHTLGL